MKLKHPLTMQKIAQQRPVMKVLCALLLFAAIVFGMTIPKLYYISEPGFARDAGGLIRMPLTSSGDEEAITGFSGTGSSEDGLRPSAKSTNPATNGNKKINENPVPTPGWYYTTIRLDRANMLQALSAWIGGGEVYTARSVLGGLDEATYMKRMNRIMLLALQDAAEAASKEAGIPLKSVSQSVVVESGGALGEGLKLEVGDMVLKAGEKPVHEAVGLLTELDAAFNAEAPMRLEIERDGNRFELEGRVELQNLARLSSSKGPQDSRQPSFNELRQLYLPGESEPLEWGEAGAGGPSAGLMAALAWYDLLDQGDLLAGRAIAGTGTLDVEGFVGAVGGVAEKVNAAAAAGAEWFLVPASEAKLAEGAARSVRRNDRTGQEMNIIAVTSLAEAIEMLQSDAL
ncbi:PDZ domain-containing secreted protein [Paenibacillaceae bacterium GAS479]|nr:PDZ domain-containing secreted protein [Paenibacillaceae bacterium GAS479]